MTGEIAAVLAVAVLLAAPVAAQSPSSPAPLVFFDIAGPDMAVQRTFYENVLGWKPGVGRGPSSNVTVPVLSPTLGGTLRADPAGSVLYFGVDDVTATLQRVVENGGKIQSPRFAVPGVVVLGLFLDPAGNLVGLVEMKDGKAVVPR